MTRKLLMAAIFGPEVLDAVALVRAGFEPPGLVPEGVAVELVPVCAPSPCMPSPSATKTRARSEPSNRGDAIRLHLATPESAGLLPAATLGRNREIGGKLFTENARCFLNHTTQAAMKKAGRTLRCRVGVSFRPETRIRRSRRRRPACSSGLRPPRAPRGPCSARESLPSA